MSIAKKLLIAGVGSFLVYKGVKIAMGIAGIEKNFNYDITFNRIQRFYIKDTQLRCVVILNIILYNGTNSHLKAKQFSTDIKSSDGYLLATTAPVDVDLKAGETYKRTIEVDANIIGFLSSLSGSYKLTGINRLTVMGLPITQKPYIIDVGPYIVQAGNAISWVKTMMAGFKKPAVAGLGCAAEPETTTSPSPIQNALGMFSIPQKIVKS